MPNLPLAFSEILAGGLFVAAAVTGDSLADIVNGAVSTKPLPGSSGAAATFAGAATNTIASSGAAAANPASLPAGIATFDGKPVAAWIKPVLDYARSHGWKGTVTSGYRSDAEQTAIYNSGVRPAAVPKSLGGAGSNHEGDAFPSGAVDVSDAAQLSSIIQGSPFAKLLVWAGSKDPVHFSHPHGGGY